MARVNRPKAAIRRAVIARDGGVCVYCGGKANTVDHVVPRSKGGPNAQSNLVAACHACNQAKADNARIIRSDAESAHSLRMKLVGTGVMPDVANNQVIATDCRHCTTGQPHSEALCAQERARQKRQDPPRRLPPRGGSRGIRPEPITPPMESGGKWREE